MSLRNYLKGIADALRNNGANNEPINAQDFSYKIYEIAEQKYSAGMAEGYNRGQEVGYENGHEEGYNKGYLDASPQETVSGEAIGITDISPIEHNMAVSVRGKNLLDKNSIEVVTAYIDTSGLWSFSSDSKSIRIPCLPNTTYTIMGENANNTVFRAGYTSEELIPYQDATGIYKVQLYNWVRNSSFTPITITTGNDAKYLAIQMSSAEWDKNIDKLQIEIGTTSTSYTPYIEDISTVKLFKSGEGVEPIMYDVQADGTVAGVTSLYPSTTLYTDTSGAVIDCTYYQDGKKVKENLTNKVSSIESVTEEVTE